MEFVLGGTAGVCAGFFSNPFDVIKTRQQVQGELYKTDRAAKLPYRGTWTAVQSIVKAEGVRGLQKGLVPALGFQFVMNGTRMGMFQVLDNARWTRDPVSDARSPLRCLLWGGAAGVLGSAIACPMNMVKTQIQIQSVGQFAVGYQHHHSGTWDAFRTAYRANGLRGVWRGFSGIVPRTCVASAIQMPTFTLCKDEFSEWEIFQGTHLPVVIASSVVTSWFMVCGMTPFDVVSTRLFNQGVDERGRGLYYRNIFDCFAKTVRHEGVRGLYKGFLANYCRILPHTILHLTFWEQFKAWNDMYFGAAPYRM